MKRFIAYLTLLFLLALFQTISAQDLEVHFINVGQGNSIFIKTLDDKTILIDAEIHYASKDKYNPFLYSENPKHVTFLEREGTKWI